MATYKKQTSDKSGMPPGTIIYVGANPPQATQCVVHIYDSQNYQTFTEYDFVIVHEALAHNKHVWIDIAGLADTNQINQVCNELKIHPLIIEDIVNTQQRPKLELFELYAFLVFKLIGPPSKRFTYTSEQFSLLMKKNLLITFRESKNYDLSPLYQRLQSELSMIHRKGSDYLTYLVMDNIVDHYFNYVEDLTDVLEKMEDSLIADPEKISLKEIYTLRRHALTLRKSIGPLSDIVHLLLTDDAQLINAAYRLYYRDLYDHTLRLLESINMTHDMTSSMLDIYLSTLNTGMNRTMKVLTQFASIFIPLTFIVGVYGMNFDYMPELKWHYGYPAVMTLMACIVLGMLYYFKRKKIF